MDQETPKHTPTKQIVQEPVSPPQQATIHYAQPAPVAQPARQSDVSKLLIVLIFLLLMVAAGILFFNLGKNPKSGLGFDPELESLRNQLQQKRGSLGVAGTGSSGLSAEGLAGRISDDAITLSDLLGKYSNSLSVKDGLVAQKQSEIDNLNRLNSSLSDQLLNLKKQLQDSDLNSALKAKLENDLADTKRLLAAANEEIARLNAQFREMPDALAYQSTLEQLERLRAQINAAPSQSELIRLEEENRRLREELMALKTKSNRSRLFAENADMLSPNGQRLYARLAALEGSTNNERLQVYQDIKNELNARVVDSVNFASGSSTVNAEKSSVIQKSLLSTSSTAEYLIVGYASKSGDAALNRELSAKRATSVATLTDIQRGATQTVKAVFLGQTNRFSTTNDFSNQICEIWEIIPE